MFLYSYFSEKLIYSLVNIDVDSITSFVNSFGSFSLIIFIFLIILEVVFAPIPPTILYLAGGFLFGTLVGSFLILIGNLIGAGIDFLLARKLGRHFVEKRINKKAKKRFDNFSKKYGGISIFILRLNPFTSSDLFSYVAGMSKMKFRSFFLGTALGLAPLIFLHTYIGETLVRGNSLWTMLALLFGIIYLVIFIYLIVLGFINSKKNS